MRNLYWGDNLVVLREHIPDESVDLIYLDPPFNSNRNYNVLFKENDRVESDAQIRAFDDTWHWTDQAEEAYQYLVYDNRVPQEVSTLIAALRSFIGSNDMMAYLVMMTVRLIELHRVLKPTGSIYLHCDPTASHYLKVVMDTIWGPKNFRNEIIWRRTSSHNDARKRYGAQTDTILFYAKSGRNPFNVQYRPYDKDYIESKYRHVDESGRRYRLDNLNPPGGRGPVYQYRQLTRPWRFTEENMLRLEREGRIYTRSRVPQLKRYLEEMPGIPLGNLWDDIDPINSRATERLGYPTQKPEILLERIIEASSNPGDIVLDPFCGCGTATAVAERLGRQWIGIDITHLAVALIKSRLESSFPGIEIRLEGLPEDTGGARALAENDRYEFQNWALSLVSARPIATGPTGGSKKGADRGVDGVISFMSSDRNKPHRCLVQVKSGHVSSATIRDLVGAVAREQAEMGLLVTMEEPTRPMRVEALEAGYYWSESKNRTYPKIQILSVADWFNGKRVELPALYSPYQLAAHRNRQVEQRDLFSDQAVAER